MGGGAASRPPAGPPQPEQGGAGGRGARRRAAPPARGGLGAGPRAGGASEGGESRPPVAPSLCDGTPANLLRSPAPPLPLPPPQPHFRPQPGLWCLHLAGVALGRLLRAAPPPAPAGAEASAAAASFAHARALLPPTALLRAACAGCGALGGWRPPRRACGDAHYTLWVASHCATLLLACALACAVDDGGEGGGGRGGDGSAQQQQPPRSVGLVAALSARGAALATFLAANVLTGAANVGLRAALPGRGPAGVPPAPAAAGLAAYVLAVAAFACWAGRGGG